MRDGKAHQVPLIVGTNAEEAQLFTRFLPLLPMTQPMIERLLADADAERRDRITSAYRGYPASSACVQLGGDFAFGTAAWQVAEARKVSNDVQARWRAFSRTGVPGAGWPAYSADQRAVMVFDRNPRVRPSRRPPTGLGRFHAGRTVSGG
jgi:carboxylesterase type B